MNRYKTQIINLLNNQFIKGSAVVFIGTFLVNVITYLFNIIVGRLLGDNAKFGEYYSLMSIVYLLSVPAAMFGTTVTKFVSVASATGDVQRIKQILLISSKYTIYFVSVISVILFLLYIPINKALKISDSQNLFWLILVYATSFPLTLPGSTLNGLQKFAVSVIYNAILIIIRLILSSLLIISGYSVNGILIALVISNILIYAIQMVHLENILTQLKTNLTDLPGKIRQFSRKIFHSKSKQESEIKKELLGFSQHAIATMMGLGILVQADIILAKIFLSPQDAGTYASLALIGKVIPFFSQPLIQVMFPYITKKYTRKENFLGSFVLVVGFVFICSGAFSLIYNFFPKLIVQSFFGSKFIASAQYIGLFSLFQVLYALINVFVFFFLSINKNKQASAVLVAGFAQIIGIFLFHNNITQIINVSITVGVLLVFWYGFNVLNVYTNIRNKHDFRESNSV